MSTARDNIKPIESWKMKLHNRRVMGSILKDGSFIFNFKRLERREPFVTRIRLTQEALAAMCVIANKLTGRGK